jgi:membrane protease YdiL (CAAX protease family)
LAETAVATQVDSQAAGPEISVTRKTRLFGLVILLAVSISSSLFNSTLSFLSAEPAGSDHDLAYVRLLLKQVASLGLLVYILQRNRQELSDIGFELRSSDLIHGGFLIIAGWIAFGVPRGIAISVYNLVVGHAPSTYVSSLGSTSLTIGVIVALVNPFFEELVVRAFLISEVIFLTGSVTLAVALSVVLQSAYHLYQGVPNAIAHGCVFLMFSLYYVRTGRTWPIVIAHMYRDMAPVLYYHSHHIR